MTATYTRPVLCRSQELCTASTPGQRSPGDSDSGHCGPMRGVGGPHKHPEDCQTGAREGFTGIHRGRTCLCAGRPSGGHWYRSTKRLLSGVTAPTPPPQTGMAGVEAMLQHLLPGMASQARPGPARRDWNTIVCFSCGKSGHGVSRCPELNETFMLPDGRQRRWAVVVMISPRVAAERLRPENGD